MVGGPGADGERRWLPAPPHGWRVLPTDNGTGDMLLESLHFFFRWAFNLLSMVR